MKKHPTAGLSIWRSAGDFALAFWPLLATAVVIIFSIRLHQPLIGMTILTGLALARKRWWSCIFGILNMAGILGGFLVCAIRMFAG